MTLLSPQVRSHLVGVIDLRQGQPVHAIAGRRHAYRPVQLPGTNQPSGASDLASFYRSLGLTKLYVADLDGLVDGNPQWNAIEQLLAREARFDEVLLDVGWRGQESAARRKQFAHLLHSRTELRPIAAAESAVTPAALAALCDLLSPGRVFVGLEYFQGRWIAESGDEAGWIESAITQQIGGAVVLDLDSVGRGQGPTTADACRRVKQACPSLCVVSGGGIRTADDYQVLAEAGCDRGLVATALFEQPATP